MRAEIPCREAAETKGGRRSSAAPPREATRAADRKEKVTL